MTSTASPVPSTSGAPAGPTTSGLRSLYLIRAIFSIIWVALVFATSTTLTSADRLSVITAVLLVIYPLWDAVATIAGARISGGGTLTRISAINVVLGLAATIAMAIAVTHTVALALLVFGIWAILSGALQLVVAIQRRPAVGAQWPIIVSGGQSVLAGAYLVAISTAATGDLGTVAGYSAIGAFWFLVAAIALTVRGRRIGLGASTR